MSFVLVGVGGFLGAIVRYSLYLLINAVAQTPFPLATLFINFSGCLAAGAMAFLVEKQAPIDQHLALLVSMGFLGAYTTFSAFGVETFSLLKSGHFGWAVLNVTFQVVLGVVGVWCGQFLANRL